MKKHVIFIHGAGEGAYAADKILAINLQKELGSAYDVHYPAMPDEAEAPYDLWKQTIAEELAAIGDSVILVGHSVGASHLAKIVCEIKIKTPIIGIFLLNAPFWGGKGWLFSGYEVLVLSKDTASKFPKDAALFLYHTSDDAVVPFGHLALYTALLPHATIREIKNGGHQMNNDLSQVANDIRSL